ncbi:hypothetical protein FIBSPDRAFT_881512 [Athelia psychrophila]|uniref:Uncharacterized protein n=1 Tax=Athelia psychrophila TaxID=1759441 RepID=A0A166WSC2_9AGAM|nr:hypothetical protein FIBSPDRAFT_881512 [Fibularhizoctonia sp. CBS 109695]
MLVSLGSNKYRGHTRSECEKNSAPDERNLQQTSVRAKCVNVVYQNPSLEKLSPWAEGRDVVTQDRNLRQTASNYSREKLSLCGEGRDAAPKDWNLQQTVSRKAVANYPGYPADSNPGGTRDRAEANPPTSSRQQPSAHDHSDDGGHNTLHN